jgi:hypothetical protein
MKQANIDLKVTGISGGSPTYNENKGQVTAFIDSGYARSQFISIDAFEGTGESYKKREEVKITIQDKYGKVWQGNFAELTAMLFENVPA